LVPITVRIVQWGVITLLFALPLIFSFSFTSFLVPKEALFQIATVVLAAVWLTGKISSARHVRRRTALDLPIIAFILLSASSLLYSPTTHSSLRALGMVVSFALFYFIVADVFVTKTARRRGIAALVAGGLVSAVIGIAQLAGLMGWALPEFPGNPQRIYSTFGNDSGLAGYLMIILPLEIGYVLAETRVARKLFLFGAVGATLFAIFACGTRGVWLSLGISLPIALVLSLSSAKLRPVLHRNRLHLGAACAILLIVFLVQSVVPGLTSGDTSIFDRITSSFDLRQRGVNDRLRLWRSALSIFADQPIAGSGLGTFKYLTQEHQARYFARKAGATLLVPTEIDTVRAHNDYLQLVGELGILGAIVVLWGMYRTVRAATSHFRNTESGDEAMGLVALVASLVSVAFFALTNFPFHVVTHAAACAFVLALVVSAPGHVRPGDSERHIDEENRRKRLPLPWPRMLAASAVWIGSLALLCLLGRGYVADYMLARADSIEDHNSPHIEALRKYESAARLDPHNGTIRASLGVAYLVRNRPTDARVNLEQSTKEYSSGKLCYNLGTAFDLENDLQNAVKYYENTVYLWPRFYDGYLRLGGALIRAGRYAEAKETLESALSWGPRKPVLLNNLATACYYLGQVGDAKGLWRESLRIEPGQEQVVRFLATLENAGQRDAGSIEP